MENDDVQVGRVLTRREWLALLGVAGVSTMAGSAGLSGLPVAKVVGFPACVVRPAQMEGPYFVDEKLNRSDIRSNPTDGKVRPGAPLQLGFRVSRIDGSNCRPLEGTLVDVWQCDALGVYAGVKDTNARFDTVGQKFLRGYQTTDANGAVRFTTIYPGWYQGRTIHIHFKIRTTPTSGRAYEFTSQLYFDDALSDRVMRAEPYAGKGARTVRNEQDGLFRQGGEQLMLAVTQAGSGYAGTFDIGLQFG